MLCEVILGFWRENSYYAQNDLNGTSVRTVGLILLLTYLYIILKRKELCVNYYGVLEGKFILCTEWVNWDKYLNCGASVTYLYDIILK